MRQEKLSLFSWQYVWRALLCGNTCNANYGTWTHFVVFSMFYISHYFTVSSAHQHHTASTKWTHCKSESAFDSSKHLCWPIKFNPQGELRHRSTLPCLVLRLRETCITAVSLKELPLKKAQHPLIKIADLMLTLCMQLSMYGAVFTCGVAGGLWQVQNID